MVFGTAWYVRVDSKSVARLPLEDSVGIVVCVHKVASENVRIYGIYSPVRKPRAFKPGDE